MPLKMAMTSNSQIATRNIVKIQAIISDKCRYGGELLIVEFFCCDFLSAQWK